jgi:hypothetical protein
MSDRFDLVRRSLSDSTADTYMDRVESQAASLREEAADGTLDNQDYAVGLEMEVYAVGADEDSRSLRALPEAVFEGEASKELGLHNAEINTGPDRFDATGLDAQAAQIARRFERADGRAREHGSTLVLDAMWTTPPEGGSDPYLTATDGTDDITVAANMRPDPRYVAIDNDILAHADGAIEFDVPGVNRAFPSILFESLATSIQPHLQIPSTASFPAHYNAAIRTLGPVLALGTNSPFLPPDLYESPEDPHDLVDESHHELRIAAFEQSVNTTPNPKVRVPEDIDSVADTIDQVVADDLCAPFLREWVTEESRATFADRNWEFDYKRSTYWRWLRCVIGGDPVPDAGDERSVRIEYRPIPTQPTIRDVVGMQLLTVGLLRGLIETDHPIADLDWERAEESFYSAAREGIDATLHWITAEGEQTTDSAVIFEEIFDVAREGLAAGGSTEGEIDEYLVPIERRWDERMTPSVWKKERVRAELAAGSSLSEAIRSMQESYIERSRETDSFVEWLDDSADEIE